MTASAKRRKKTSSRQVYVRYTGSPDSVTVARLLEDFKYNPDKSDAVLSRYRRVASKTR